MTRKTANEVTVKNLIIAWSNIAVITKIEDLKQLEYCINVKLTDKRISAETYGVLLTMWRTVHSKVLNMSSYHSGN